MSGKHITHFFTKDIVIRRLKTVSGNKKAFHSTATVEGMIQGQNKVAGQRLGIIEERTFIAWFDIDEDIQEGDRIVDKNNNEYYAKTVTKKDYGINTHLEVILEAANE